MASTPKDEIVENPTFLEHIRHFFDPIDIDHMRRVAGMDLASYDGVKSKASQIYFQTQGRIMPPEPERHWSEARVKTFRNWIRNKYPMGVAPLQRSLLKADNNLLLAATATRRDARNLSAQEVDRLALAFDTIMKRSPDEPQSYFVLAAIHWFPEPTYCAHHEMRYNPWHRVYLDRFEAALQSVPGCEDITMPYWDILGPIPEWFDSPPFDSYQLQAPAGARYPAGTRTRRFPRADIEGNLVTERVAPQVRRAMNEPGWESFTNYIEGAHDSGHVSCGPSLATPDIAAFDPLFWFFHCNWERLFWAWQRRYQANELATFRKTLERPEETDWLDTDGLNALDPFAITTPETIDNSMYFYEDAAAELFDEAAILKSGNVALGRTFRLATDPKLSIRVKDIARLNIRGSFIVHLLADGQEVDRRAFFQSTEPGRCVNCVKRPLVNVDFLVDRETIVGKSLDVAIETLEEDRIAELIPLSQVGSPTINVRELVAPD